MTLKGDLIHTGIKDGMNKNSVIQLQKSKDISPEAIEFIDGYSK